MNLWLYDVKQDDFQYDSAKFNVMGRVYRYRYILFALLFGNAFVQQLGIFDDSPHGRDELKDAEFSFSGFRQETKDRIYLYLDILKVGEFKTRDDRAVALARAYD